MIADAGARPHGRHRAHRRRSGRHRAALLAHRNIASKAATIHRYDHEIGGGTVVRPLVGVHGDAPGDGVVLADPGDTDGIAIGIGVNPWYGLHDPGRWPTPSSTRRSATSSPSAPTPIGSPCSTTSRGATRGPSTLGELVAAVDGCFAAAIAHGRRSCPARTRSTTSTPAPTANAMPCRRRW